MDKKSTQARPNHLLRAARKERGWTQKDVADRIGAPLALNITRWEGGKAFPSAHYVEKLCQLFGKSAKELGLLQDDNLASSHLDEDTNLPNEDADVDMHRSYAAPSSAWRAPSRFSVLLFAGSALLFIIASSMAYNSWNITHQLPPLQRTVSTENAGSIVPIDATATFVATYPNPYPPRSGKIAFYDPLNGPYLWANGTDAQSGSVCQFKQGAYSISESKTQFAGTCFNSDIDEGNFTLEVQMKIIQGDCGGIIFRSNDPKEYQFTVCQDGYYQLALYQDPTHAKMLVDKFSPAITVGLNQPNVLAIVANGSSLDLYANRQKIAGVYDSAYSHGQIALVAQNNQSSLTEVLYKYVKVWRL